MKLTAVSIRNAGALASGWWRILLTLVALLMGATAYGAGVLVSSVTTSDTVGDPEDNLPGKVFQHDLVPAKAMNFAAIISGFPEKDPATVVSLLEDGVVVRVVGEGGGGIPNGTVENVDYTPTSAGAKTYVVQATNGSTTATSAAIRVNVYGVSIAQPQPNSSAAAGSDLFINGSALLRNGVVATVQFYIDGVLAGIDTNAPYAVAWRPTSTGIHALTAVLISSTGATVNSPTVSFTVVPAVSNGTLAVSLTSPTSGATVAAGTAVTVLADPRLTGSAGAISEVQFYVNGVALGTPDTTFPFSTNWAPATAGNYVLTVIAKDDKDNTRASTGIVVTVTGNVPAVVLTSPANNAVVMAGGGVSLIATPSGQDGTVASVASVQFFVDGNAVGSATAVPFMTSWLPIQSRPTPYTITARVTATNGAQASSEPALVTVLAAETRPSIVLTTSNGTASVPEGQTVTLTALAADQTGSTATVAAVEFFVDGTDIASVSTAPYTTTWTPLFARSGAYVLDALVILRNGMTSRSAPISVNVVPGSAPSVTITAPLAGQSFASGSTLTLAAAASDVDGGVRSVQFFVNGVALGGTLTTAPYEVNFTPTQVGDYTITARAVDNTAKSTTSAPVTISAKASVGQPPVAFLSIVPDTAEIPKRYTAGSSLTVGLSASDPDGTIARVSFYFEGAKIAERLSPPYVASVQLPSATSSTSDRTLSAVVEDNDGNQTNTVETIRVFNIARPLPSATLNAPASGAVFTYGSAITVEATLANASLAVSGVVFAENGSVLRTLTAAPYKFSYTPATSGTKTITAVPYYTTRYSEIVATQTETTSISIDVVTSASVSSSFTVKDFAPLIDAESFVAQTYLDLAQRTATGSELTAGVALIGASGRGKLAATVTAGTAFDDGFNALAAAWLITGEWPRYDRFAAGVGAIRSDGLAAWCGTLLATSEYVAHYGATPTLTSLTGTNSYPALQAFATQLYQNAYGRNPTLAEIQAVANAPSSATQAGGLNVVGLNAFLAEFVAKNSATVAARVRAAGLYIALLRLQPTAEQVAALAAKSAEAAATELLANTSYATRFLSITRQPLSLQLATGAAGQLAVDVSGTAPFTYQWYQNGALIPGATSASLLFRSATAANAGIYYVVVTSPTSRVVSNSASVAVVSGTSRLVNISTRGYAAPGDDTLIAGFVLGGGATKRMLIRAVGPALAAQGVAGALENPRLEVHQGSYTILANDDWAEGDVAGIESTAVQVGAFALTRGSRDAAAVATLSNGVYSVLATNSTGNPGVAMIEIYDAGTASDVVRLINLSSRARVGTGDQIMIAGFVISGNVAKRVLVRAVGPGLLAQGVKTALTNPQLRLTGATGTLAENDDWSASMDAALIASAATQVGAFPLVGGSLDSAVIVSLPPGVYSALVSGVGGTTGIALVEVYDVDP